MKQITEDYCNFEVAKLLKEKGFDEPYCNCYLLLDEGGYTEVEMSDECHQGERYDSESSSWKFGTLLLRPTHQMALKWLREVHNIYIDILTYTTGKNIQFRWVGYEKGRLFSQEEGKTIYFDSYEQAIEAALSYVLKNLI